MNQPQDDRYLAGKLLLSMPNMGDPRFHKAVIYVCAHDENGAMGLVINHVLPGLDLQQLLKQLNIELDQPAQKETSDIQVMSGGPVETARGFVIHSTDFEQNDTVKINSDIYVTGTVDALKAIANGEGPSDMIFALGYAGWSAGQLDEEIQKNAWLIMDADTGLLFETTPEKKWENAISKLGIDPAMLSGTAGRA